MPVSGEKKALTVMLREELMELLSKYPQDIAMATLTSTYFTLTHEILGDSDKTRTLVNRQLELSLDYLEKLKND